MTTQTKNKKMTRYMAINSIKSTASAKGERKFSISFSSEEPYERWFGLEILDHTNGAADLTRLNEIGCVLFNHDRNKVIGKINWAKIENNRGSAEIEFDIDAESEVIYQKVLSGTLKGISLGYRVLNWESVLKNQKSLDGRIDGPAEIAKKWEAFEISIVSIPADPTVGVGRELGNEEGQKVRIGSLLDTYERQIQINKNNLNLGGLI